MNILVVEDEQKVAAFLKNGLEEQGYRVELAYDGYTGEKLALSRDYDVMLLDVITRKTTIIITAAERSFIGLWVYAI